MRLAVLEDRRHVTVAEATGVRGGAQRLIDGVRAVQLAPDPRRARRGRGDPPRFGARADGQERLLVRAARSGLALDRARRPRRVVLIRTVASEPPLLSGSAGTQVAMVSPL